MIIYMQFSVHLFQTKLLNY